MHTIELDLALNAPLRSPFPASIFAVPFSVPPLPIPSMFDYMNNYAGKKFGLVLDFCDTLIVQVVVKFFLFGYFYGL